MRSEGWKGEAKKREKKTMSCDERREESRHESPSRTQHPVLAVSFCTHMHTCTHENTHTQYHTDSRLSPGFSISKLQP